MTDQLKRPAQTIPINPGQSQDEFFARRHVEREEAQRAQERMVEHLKQAQAATGSLLPQGVEHMARDALFGQRPDRPEDVASYGVKFDRGKPRLSKLPAEWLADLAQEVEHYEKVANDPGIVRLDLIPPGVLVEIAALYGRGARKYDDRNWEKGFDWSRSYDAVFRHMKDFWQGEDFDPESRALHPIAMAWNSIALAWFYRNRPEFDDRPKSPPLKAA